MSRIRFDDRGAFPPHSGPVRKRISIVSLLIAWLFANGAVWDVVQVVAWAKMFRDYSQVMPASEALRLTFDGEACNLCDLAQSGQDVARKQSPQDVPSSGADRLLFAYQAVPTIILTAPEADWPRSTHENGMWRAEPVPLRPPRV